MTNTDNSILDVLIVGGGPIGLELAVAAKKANLRYELCEADQIGHTMSWWAPQTRWFSSNERISIAGIPLDSVDQMKATREQYLAYLRGVVRQHNLHVRSHTPISSVVRQSEFFVVGGTFNTKPIEVRTKNIVLAIGGTDAPNKLNVPGSELPHVDSYFREPHNYFGRRVLIIGGRNSAVEAALRATLCGATVSISYRQPDLPRESIKYWLLPEISGLINSGRIKAYFGTVPTSIELDRVILRSLLDDQLMEIEADVVLSLIGYAQDKTLFRACNIDLIGESQRPVFDETTMMTNVPGIYVAGTAVAGTQSSKYRVFVENCHDHVDKIICSLTQDSRHKGFATSNRPNQELTARIEAMPES